MFTRLQVRTSGNLGVDVLHLFPDGDLGYASVGSSWLLRAKEVSAVTSKTEEILEALKLQRSILKDGGYGRSVRTPRKEVRLLRDSVTCLHVEEEVKSKPCDDCILAHQVPAEYRNEEYPCHFIPLNERGDTLHSLLSAGDREEAERVLLEFLDSAIAQMERELAGQTPQAIEAKAG